MHILRILAWYTHSTEVIPCLSTSSGTEFSFCFSLMHIPLHIIIIIFIIMQRIFDGSYTSTNCWFVFVCLCICVCFPILIIIYVVYTLMMNLYYNNTIVKIYFKLTDKNFSTISARTLHANTKQLRRIHTYHDLQTMGKIISTD